MVKRHPEDQTDACVIQVIQVRAHRGVGTVENPHRIVRQFWSFEGALLAEDDPATEAVIREPTLHKNPHAPRVSCADACSAQNQGWRVIERIWGETAREPLPAPSRLFAASGSYASGSVVTDALRQGRPTTGVARGNLAFVGAWLDVPISHSAASYLRGRPTGRVFPVELGPQISPTALLHRSAAVRGCGPTLVRALTPWYPRGSVKFAFGGFMTTTGESSEPVWVPEREPTPLPASLDYGRGSATVEFPLASPLPLGMDLPRLSTTQYRAGGMVRQHWEFVWSAEPLSSNK